MLVIYLQASLHQALKNDILYKKLTRGNFLMSVWQVWPCLPVNETTAKVEMGNLCLKCSPCGSLSLRYSLKRLCIWWCKLGVSCSALPHVTMHPNHYPGDKFNSNVCGCAATGKACWPEWNPAIWMSSPPKILVSQSLCFQDPHQIWTVIWVKSLVPQQKDTRHNSALSVSAEVLFI